MIKTQGKGNPNGKILIIENIENERDNHEKYQIFHNKIYYLPTKKINFKTNFFLIKETELSKKSKKELFQLIQKFDIIIFNCLVNIKPNEIENLFSVKLQEKEKWKSNKYSSYTNTNKTKIIINTNSFENLENEDINDLHFDLIAFLKINEIIYYQFNCPKCNDFNLKILHNTEPLPRNCKKCKQPIFDSKGKIKNNILILENGKLRNELYKRI